MRGIEMPVGIHDKIIKNAAKEILSPLGLFQVGQSRVWLDDNGWFLIVIEFQPSGGSKGAYLNVGINFLWTKQEYLSFDFGHRENNHIEYTKNDDLFYKEMLKLAEVAKDKIMIYRQFHNFPYAKKAMMDSTQMSSSWEKWHIAMMCFLAGDSATGERNFNQFIDSGFRSPFEWYRNYCKEQADIFMPIFEQPVMLKRQVLETIKYQRSFFRAKTSYRKLRIDNDYDSI
jgi:hypothetical protein